MDDSNVAKPEGLDQRLYDLVVWDREAVKKSTEGLHNTIAKSKNVRTLQE